MRPMTSLADVTNCDGGDGAGDDDGNLRCCRGVMTSRVTLIVMLLLMPMKRSSILPSSCQTEGGWVGNRSLLCKI